MKFVLSAKFGNDETLAVLCLTKGATEKRVVRNLHLLGPEKLAYRLRGVDAKIYLAQLSEASSSKELRKMVRERLPIPVEEH